MRSPSRFQGFRKSDLENKKEKLFGTLFFSSLVNLASCYSNFDRWVGPNFASLYKHSNKCLKCMDSPFFLFSACIDNWKALMIFSDYRSGLPDGLFLNPNPPFWYILEALWTE
jgi:hypothetical protein